MTITILGGGLTGLTLANLLDSENIIILEKEDVCGGLCRSIQEKGYTFDLGGSHVIFSKDNEVLEFMKNILGDNICQKRRNTKVLYKGRFIKYPFENGLGDLSKQDNFECLLGYLNTYDEYKSGKQLKPNNFEEWIYYTFGKGIAEKYLIPYNRKIWKLDPSQTDLTWVGDRIPQPPVEDVIKASLGLESEGYLHQLNFYYPREGGIQALTDKLEKKVRDKIIYNFRINTIERIGDEWLISNGSSYIICKEIISTISIFDLTLSLKDVPESVKNAVSNLRYNSLITVMIGINCSNINNFSWLYIPEMNCLSHRISFPSNYSDMVAPIDKSSILAEITYNENNGTHKLSDDSILQNIVEYLHQNKLINKNDIEYTKINRMKYAYVVNDLNYDTNIRIIKSYMEKIGIHLVGRFSEWEYLNMDACIRNAINFVSRRKNDR